MMILDSVLLFLGHPV